MRLRAVIALLALLPLAALAADEPEIVYGKFHRAMASSDLEEMGRHAPDARRAELATMSEAQKEATVKMAAVMVPRAFTLRQKQVHPNGQSALLVVSGPGMGLMDGRPETLYGSIKMVMQRGEWKVSESNWSNDPPANLAAMRPGGAPQAADKTGKPAVAAKGGAPVVGSMESGQTGRKLGAAKPECVYKPVMTAQDMENCK